MRLSFHDAARDDIEDVSRGRGETGRRNGLETYGLSAPGETPDAELPKLGETSCDGNPEPSPVRAVRAFRANPAGGEGVETRRAAPVLQHGRAACGSRVKG